MLYRAHAKINLTLEVLGKRGDGYHEIRSVMRTLALHDEIELLPAPAIELHCNVPELASVHNLAFRAAALLRAEARVRAGARITIAKAIPVAAGLGGGSSDAGTVLRALNQFWGAGLEQPMLEALAARLGSDVPFFLTGGTSVASGRGETIMPLESQPDCPVLLVNPGFALATADVYQALAPEGYSQGGATAAFANLPPGTGPARWPLANDLQPVSARLRPIITDILRVLHQAGAIQAMMCGSGPTCFGLFANKETAAAAAATVRATAWHAWLTNFN
jgi:4-diphosphocytidyl-2-C-methyl-D-erythritol kinase